MSMTNDNSTPKNDDVDSHLSSYLNSKSPLIGQLEFDASVLPPPVDPKFIDYEINDEIVKYKLTSLEFSERLSSFTDFNCGISDSLLHGTSFTGCGIENQKLMDLLESNLLDNMYKDADAQHNKYGDIKRDLLDLVKYFESIKMVNLVNKSKELLPNYVQNLLSTNADVGLLNKSRIKMYRELETRSTFKHSSESSHHSPSPKRDSELDSDLGSSPYYNRPTMPVDSATDSPLQDEATRSYKDWESMSTDERVEVYLSELEKTFVRPDDLVHPTNKYLKKAKVYNIVPNSRLWSNKYIQVGIDGVSLTSDANSKLEVDGVIRLAKETQTQRFFEYYKPYEPAESSASSSSGSEEVKSADDVNVKVKEEKQDEGIDDLFAEDIDNLKDQESMSEDQLESTSDTPSPDQDGNLYKFIRQYTSQKVSKLSGTENYFLLTLPKEVSERFEPEQPYATKSSKAHAKDEINVKEEVADEKDLQQVELVPIRGPRLVFSKAGVNKRPDIRISYLTS